MPTVSVVMTVYNGEKTIVETISSVLKQTFSDFEIIVVNNGSTDNTLEVLKNIQDQRLKVFSYEHVDLPTSLNRCFSHATGEFLAFLDADDLWTSDKLELQVQALQKNPKAGIAYSWTNFIDEQGQLLGKGEPIYFKGNVLANLLVCNFIASGSNALIRKKAIESGEYFDPECGSCTDWDYWLRIASKWEFVLVPKYQVFYRQSSHSTSSKIEQMEKACVFVVEKAFKTLPPEFQYLKNQSLATVYQYCTRKYLQNYSNSIDNLIQARKKLWMAISLYPPILLQGNTQRLIIGLIKRWIVTELLKTKFLASRES
ncbi:MAG: glycosyltransferase [Chlorogloeopsis fritschii C42_A2020_084]|uniref:glycosyltransferase family 2 protein n=1 Tax=Chlorogloeopsis fritschii TaxID=1124 RepID=UPI0019EBCDAD|nr:glycosyltransferase [Chlorogloeopsis fritschii]MBF2009539.1 glycosyltransferase [Chlorogloeopsis fritschii C42_A2020_084]